ncbi:MAG: efflux RND transporter periplasmic adaptor subunit [Salaquimonas sp.]|nr:efflux RND transporter periplasmic adaptor subunit [Salaquimonas sp.]
MILRFAIAVILLALVAGGLVGFNMFRDKAIKQFFATRSAPPAAVSTVDIETTTWTPTIQAIGTANAFRGVDLAVETTGIVREIAFNANETVAANQVLVQLEDDVQQADLAAEKAQAELAHRALKRANELSERGVGSQVTLQAAEAAASAAEAQVARLEAVLQQKQLRAPFRGVIGIPRIEIGQYLTPGTVVATLQDLDSIRADFTVPEQQLPNISMGQRVRLQPGDTGKVLTGEIIGIDPKVDPASRLVSVRARIDGAKGRVTPGQFVQLEIELPRQPNVIAVPQTALLTSLYGDNVYVVREAEGASGQAADGKSAESGKKLVARQVFVTVGRRSGGLVEITGGLKQGDIVVTAGQNRLSNGATVKIDNTINPADKTEGQAVQ